MQIDTFIQGDCLDVMSGLEDDSVDLVFCSPPYEDARTYGIDYSLKDRGWVDWCVPRFMECLRVCSGLVAWNVQGKTRRYKWSCTPPMLMCALQDAGACLRNPPIYARSGIPGSGGPDWLRSDYEWIVCATREQGRLPWSDNTACGKPPKFDPGGNMTHRTKDGKRVRSANHKGKAIKSGPGSGRARKYDGTPEKQPYIPPKVANPGNIIRCSGGHLGPGGDYAHSGNEAPFPFALPQFFVKSFCPPGGIVLDPFSGSGTTAHAAYLEGRHYVGIDVRESQIELARERLAAAEAERKTRLF